MTSAARVLLSLLCLTVAPQIMRAQTRDSAGIRITTSAQPMWRSGHAWSVDPKPVLTIGEAEGEEPYLFGSIFQAKPIGKDLFAVVDYRALGIRLFDAAGRHVRTIGRQGAGPGEFKSAPTIAFHAPDTIVAYDPMQRRISWFTLDGKLAREHSFLGSPLAESLPMIATWDAWHVLDDGTVVTTGLDLSHRPPPGLTKQARLVKVVNVDKPTAVDIGAFPDRESIRAGRWGISNPFAPRSEVAVRRGTGTVFVSGPQAWEIRAYTRDGALREIIRAGIPRMKLTRAMIQKGRDRLKELRGASATEIADAERAFDGLQFADSTRAIRQILDDGTGNLWVARWNGEASSLKKTLPYNYDVIDSRGRWLGAVVVPASVGDIVAIEGNRLIAVWQDEMNVQYVRSYPIRRPK